MPGSDADPPRAPALRIVAEVSPDPASVFYVYVSAGTVCEVTPIAAPIVDASAADTTGPTQYVTLDQAAAMVHRSKRTLEKYLHEPRKVARYGMPDPTIEGGGGRAAEWDWDVIRPWLERVFRRTLPVRFPSPRG